jgi:hypothetical protein
MSRNFKSLQDEVIEHNLSDTKYRLPVKRWLNEAQDEVAKQIDIRDFFTPTTFTTSQKDNVLPDNFLRLVGGNESPVLNSSDGNDWTPLQEIRLRDFDDAPVTSGVPSSYVIAGQILYLYPYPQGATMIALLYYRKPAPMVDDADEAELPDHHRNLLITYTLKRCYERENDYDAAAYWEAQWNTMLAKAAGQLQFDTADGPRIIPGTWDEEDDIPYAIPSAPGGGGDGGGDSGGGESGGGEGGTFGGGTFGG